MGCDGEWGGASEVSEAPDGGDRREVPDWLTGNVLPHELWDRRTIELVRAAHEFGARLEVQPCCSLVTALAQRDVATVQTIEDIQTWFREVVRHPQVQYRRSLARALSGHPVGNAIMEIAGELGMVLVDDEDVEVRRAVARFIQFVGNDGSRDQHPALRDSVEPGEVYGIIGRLVLRGPETFDDPSLLIHIVMGAARTLRDHGVADYLLMQVVEPMLEGSAAGALLCAHALVGMLDECAEALEPETLDRLVAFVEGYPDAQVQEMWRDMAEVMPAQRARLEERVAAYRRRASGEFGIVADVSGARFIDPPAGLSPGADEAVISETAVDAMLNAVGDRGALLLDEDPRCRALMQWCSPVEPNPVGGEQEFGVVAVGLATDQRSEVRDFVVRVLLGAFDGSPARADDRRHVERVCSVWDLATVQDAISWIGIADLVDPRTYLLSVVGNARPLARVGYLDKLILMCADHPDPWVAHTLAFRSVELAPHIERETADHIVRVLENHDEVWVRAEFMSVRAGFDSVIEQRFGAPVDTCDLGTGNEERFPNAGQDLRGWNLRGVSWADRMLRNCDMTGCDLTGADLRGANLSGAVLYRTVLVGAQLDRADLTNAILSGADLRGAQMFAVGAEHASLVNADLRGANLTAARLRSANLERADLREAVTDGLDIHGARIVGATFDGLGPEGCL